MPPLFPVEKVSKKISILISNMKIEHKIQETIQKFNLINKKDKILVAASGGKDSTVLSYILNKLGYNIEAITIDALIENYTKQNLENLKTFCKNNKIKLHIISFKKEFGYSLSYIRSMLYSKRINLKSCTICGVLRRYLLNKHAKKLKAGIIATGHNLDDEAQSILMNLFKNNIELLAKLGPKTGIIKTKNFIPRIKPLYFISEKEITAFSKKNKFPVDYSPCPCREGAYRNHIRKLINKYEKTNPNIKKNIINSFLKIIPNLKQHYKTSAEPQTCIKCKEPSRNKICMTCQILEKLK